jgi:hypothetical protein
MASENNFNRELTAMQQIGNLLDALEEDERHRVLEWVMRKFGGVSGFQSQRTLKVNAADAPPPRTQLNTFAELFDAAQPTTDKDKALVAAYWAQICGGEPVLTAQSLNAELKHLGHGVGNITEALSQLIAERPALILQVRKSGTSKQARKQYRLTDAGKRRIDDQLGR